MRAMSKKAAINDFENINKLMNELYDFSHVEEKPGKKKMREIYEDLLSSNDHFILMAATNGEPAGFVSVSLRKSLSHEKPTATVDEIIVSKEYRGKGVGTVLIESAISNAVSLNCCEVEAVTEKDNDKALEFYRKRGFGKEMVFLEKEL